MTGASTSPKTRAGRLSSTSSAAKTLPTISPLTSTCPARLPPPWPGLGYFSIERDGKGVRRSRRRRVTGGCSTRSRKVSTADFPAIESVRYVRAFRPFLDTPTRSEVSFVNTDIRHGRLLPDQAASALCFRDRQRSQDEGPRQRTGHHRPRHAQSRPSDTEAHHRQHRRS